MRSDRALGTGLSESCPLNSRARPFIVVGMWHVALGRHSDHLPQSERVPVLPADGSHVALRVIRCPSPRGLRLGLSCPQGPASHAPGRRPEPPVGGLTSTMTGEAAMARCSPPSLGPSATSRPLVPLQGPRAPQLTGVSLEAGPLALHPPTPRRAVLGPDPRQAQETQGSLLSPKHGNAGVCPRAQQLPQTRASPCGGGSLPLTCLLLWGRASQGEILQLRDAKPLAQGHTAAWQAASFPGQLAEAEAGSQPVPHCPAGHPAWREGRPSSPTRGLCTQS